MGLADRLALAGAKIRTSNHFRNDTRRQRGGNGDDVGRFEEGEEAAYDYSGDWGNWRQVSIFSQFGLLLYLP